MMDDSHVETEALRGALDTLPAIDLGGIEVSDMTPLANLASLETLYLGSTEVNKSINYSRHFRTVES